MYPVRRAIPSPSTPSLGASWATITPYRSSSFRRSRRRQKKPRPFGTGLFISASELLAQLEDEHAAKGGERGRRARAAIGEGRVGVADVVDGDAGPGIAGPGEQAVQIVAGIQVDHHEVVHTGLDAQPRGGIASAVLDSQARREGPVRTAHI